MPDIPLPVLVESLTNGAPTKKADGIRAKAAARLAKRGDEGRAFLVLALRDSQMPVRDAALRQLEKTESRAWLKEQLSRLACEGHYGQRITAVEWLCRYPEPPAELLPRLFTWVLEVEFLPRRRERKLIELICSYPADAIHQHALLRLQHAVPSHHLRIERILDVVRQKGAPCSADLKQKLQQMARWTYPEASPVQRMIAQVLDLAATPRPRQVYRARYRPDLVRTPHSLRA